MQTVYKNALFTIAATASSDGSGGLFVPRSPEPLQASFEGLLPRSDVPASIMPRPPPIWKKMIESGPLGSRAWCFQERQLSPRVMHFTRHALVWECCTCVATDDQPRPGLEPIEWCSDLSVNKLFDGGIANNVLRIIDSISNYREVVAQGEPRSLIEVLYDRWIDCVANYSARNLSRSSNRFPALSGLAHAVMDATEDAYLAGLWRGDLCRGLLWSRGYLDSTRKDAQRWARPTGSSYRAPSWSWASIDGPVNAVHFV